jgi:hypothetical protein
MYDFLADLAEKRGRPAIGAMPINVIEKLGSREYIPVQFWAPDPLTSHHKYYYNARENKLYVRTVVSNSFALWRWIDELKYPLR